MNRNNLTAAVLAGLAGAAGIVGSAQAVNINPDGLGQLLLYPYYTTNGGNATVLSVVNTTEDAKAVKVRFLEGENSREVLDFNLYMSKYDVWTAALVDMDGTPTMITQDTSCTVPYIYGNGGVQEFLPWALNDAAYNDVDADGDIIGVYDDISRGAEGHFEMIEMGTLVDEQVPNPKWVDIDTYPICDQGSISIGHPAVCLVPREWTEAELDEDETIDAEGSATAATHVDGVPADCQQLVDAWTVGAEADENGYWIDDAFTDILPPSGGMFGGAAVINVEAGTMYSYDAKALDGFYVAEGNYVGDESHQEPGTILPSLDSGNTTDATIFLNGQTLSATTENLTRSVDAVSFVLMHDAIMNEYTTEAIVGAATEWVITFPTKQFYVHQKFLNSYADYRDNGELDGSATEDPETAVRAPFTTVWEWNETTYDEDDEVDEEGYLDRACEVVQLDTIYDREEQTIIDPEAPPGTAIPPIVSPPPPGPVAPKPDGIIPFELCHETSVIAFGTPEAIVDETLILGSRNFHNIDSRILGFEYGWARLDLSDATSDIDQDGDLDELHRETLGGLYGLPVTGFSVNRYQNSFLGEGADVLANYGGIFQHKGTRSITSAGYVPPVVTPPVR